MKPTIYIDVLFLVNLIFNMLIFFITSFLLKKNVSSVKIFILGLVSAFYGIVIFFPVINFLNSWVIKIIFTVFCAKLLFLPKKIKELIFQSITLIFVSFVLAGAIFALVFLTNSTMLTSTVFSGGILYLDINPFILLFGVVLSVIVILVFSASEKHKIFEEDRLTEFYIYNEEEFVFVKALIDSGCLLSSADGKKALIVEKDIFENEIFSACEKFKISFSTITKSFEETMAFFPDKIKGIDGKIYSAMVVLGADSFDDEKRFNAIVNPEIFNEESGSEIIEKVI